MVFGRTDVLPEDVLKPCTSHTSIASIDKQFWGRHLASYRQPCAHRRRGFFPQRNATLSAALTVDQDARLGLESNVNNTNPDQFRHPQSTGKTEVQHCAITNTHTVCRIRSIQDRLHFLGCQMPHKTRVRLLGGNRQNAVNLFEGRWHPVLHIPHERLDRCEPNVSGSSAVSARCFQVIQEVHDEYCIDVLQLQLRGRSLQAVARIFKEEPESVRVRVTGVRAGLALQRQPLLEESRDMWRDQSHGRPPMK